MGLFLTVKNTERHFLIFFHTILVEITGVVDWDYELFKGYDVETFSTEAVHKPIRAHIYIA